MYCRSKKLLGLLLLGCLLAPMLAIAAEPNPLRTPAHSDTPYQGSFSDGQLHLKLQAQLPDYIGKLHFRGQQYALQAQQQEGKLQGYFQDEQGNRFAFQAQQQSDVLDFVTDGEHFQLRKQTPTAAPVVNPLSQAGSPTPLRPPATPTLEPNMPTFIPQTPQAMLVQFHSLNTQIGYDFQLFLMHLRQWLTGNAEAVESNTNFADVSKALLTQQLVPTVLDLQHKLEHLGILSSEMGSLMQLNPQETKLMRQFITLSNKGARFFEQWYLLLKLMLELYDSGDQEGLHQIAQQQLPGAVKNAIAFAQNFVFLVRAADDLQYRPLNIPSNNSNHAQLSLNPKQMLKLETLRNMSEMMREAMQMMMGTAER